MPKFDMPYTIVDDIAYDPQARDLRSRWLRLRRPILTR